MEVDFIYEVGLKKNNVIYHLYSFIFYLFYGLFALILAITLRPVEAISISLFFYRIQKKYLF